MFRQYSIFLSMNTPQRYVCYGIPQTIYLCNFVQLEEVVLFNSLVTSVTICVKHEVQEVLIIQSVVEKFLYDKSVTKSEVSYLL